MPADRPTPTREHPAVEFIDVRKVYPNGVVACDGVSISVEAGSVHAVIGENGAGKSTLMKMLYGLETPTSGSIRRNGQQVDIASPTDAIGHGIGMVHQNFMLVPSFTIAQNVVLGAEPVRGSFVDERRAIDETAELAERFGLHVDPRALVSDVAVGMKQRVEILKALYRGADVLVLDEPTAVLAPQETELLFAALRTLVAQGRTIIFISHKLREIMAVADTVSVMRAGELTGSVSADDTTEVELARMMVGRDVVLAVDRHRRTPGERRLVVERMTCRSDLGHIACDEIDFAVRAGEIVGIAGVEGNGQTELAQALTGLRVIESGSVRVDDTDLTDRSVADRRSAGVGHIPEDRLHDGAALAETIADNLIVDRHRRPPFARRRILSRRAIDEQAETLIDEFAIRAIDGSIAVGSLSGGNIQKVVAARELSAEPAVLIAAQPSRGVDVGAMEFMYERIVAAADDGSAVLLISADLTEVLTLSDRVLVMKDGRIVAHFDDPSTVTERQVGLAMLGVDHDGDVA